MLLSQITYLYEIVFPKTGFVLPSSLSLDEVKIRLLKLSSKFLLSIKSEVWPSDMSLMYGCSY